MSELQVQGLIVHIPGVWGDSMAALGATIVIYQTSVGSGAREIWRYTTGDDGAYSGKTSEWRRMATVSMGIAGSYQTPDLTDILNLSFKVTHGSQEARGPFVYLGDHLPSPPIILSWGPLGGPLARLNGVDCYTVAQVTRICKQTIQTLGSIDIEFGFDTMLPDRATADFFQAAVDYMRENQHFAEARAQSLYKTLDSVRTQVQTINARSNSPALTAAQAQASSNKSTTWSLIKAIFGIEIAVITAIVAVVAALFTSAGFAPAAAAALVGVTCRIVASVCGYTRPLMYSTMATVACVVLLCMMVLIMADKLFTSCARATVLQNKQGWRIRIG